MVFPFHAAAYAESGFPLARKFIRVLRRNFRKCLSLVLIKWTGPHGQYIILSTPGYHCDGHYNRLRTFSEVFI